MPIPRSTCSHAGTHALSFSWLCKVSSCQHLDSWLKFLSPGWEILVYLVLHASITNPKSAPLFKTPVFKDETEIGAGGLCGLRCYTYKICREKELHCAVHCTLKHTHRRASTQSQKTKNDWARREHIASTKARQHVVLLDSALSYANVKWSDMSMMIFFLSLNEISGGRDLDLFISIVWT